MHICLIGCGKMGTALLEGWSKLSVINEITVVEPNKINVSKNIKEKTNILFYNHLSKIKFNDLPDVVILAVKPQIMEMVFLGVLRYFGDLTKLRMVLEKIFGLRIHI